MDIQDIAGRSDNPRADPQLTVVVCTLGRASIAATVESLAASARGAGRAVETIVVWQGSDPAPSLSGACVVDAFPLGLSYARNRGLALAQGPLVGFVDDDEVVDETWAQAAIAELEDESLAGAFGPVLCTDEGGEPYFSPTQDRVVFEGVHTPPWLVGTGGNMVFRRETLGRAGGFDPRFGAGAAAGSAEETDVVLRLLGDGKRLAFTPELRVYHPSRDGEDELRARRAYAFGMGSALRRSPVLTGKYLHTIAQELGRAVRGRNQRRRREVLTTSRAFLSGLVSPLRSRAPDGGLGRLPASLAERVNGRDPKPLAGTIGERPHLRYALEGGGLLHVYPDPSAELVESVGSGDDIALDRGALWVLEN